MEFFDYDPHTGITQYYGEENGKIIIRSEQDVQPYLDFAAELRNTGWADRARGDGEYKHEGRLVAILPPIVQSQLYQRGINMLDQNDTKKLLAAIETDYPYCKVTNKVHL